MIHHPLVVLDFETTGLRPERGDRITEVGLVRIEEGRITARYGSLVNCGVRVPAFITTYTGITQQMVDSAPPVSQVMQEMADFIGDAPIVAHSATFDQRFYTRECRYVRMSRVIEPFICSMRLSRRMYPHLSSHSLGVIAHELGLAREGRAHRAVSDAAVTAELMLRVGQDLARLRPGVSVTAPLLRALMRLPVEKMQSGLERLCA